VIAKERLKKNTSMKMRYSLKIAVLLTALAGSASAQVFTYNWTVNDSVTSPVIEGFGLVNLQNIGSVTLPTGYLDNIADVNVFLNVVGNPLMYNSDMVAYLTHDSKTVFLVNRVGLTSTPNSGYGGNGMTVTLDDQKTAAYDIHFYRDAVGYVPGSDSPLAGTWAPDGRTDPLGARATNPLSTFNNSPITGNWSLYIEDSVGSSSATLVSWGLEVTAVPEPQTYATLCGLALVGFAAGRRMLRKSA